MKIPTTLLGGIALLGTTGLASAQTKVFITGSTAYRTTTIAAINNVLGVSGPVAYNGTDPTAPNVANWSTSSYLVKASFSGSAAGVQTVAAPTSSNFKVMFLPDNASGSGQTDYSQPNATGGDAEFPDMTLSDVFQNTTPFHGKFSGVTYTSLTNNLVGVVAFTFSGSVGINTTHGAATTLNMTTQLAQQIFPSGIGILSMFTGLTGGDDNIAVIPTGRNFDSGTRLTAVTETNIGTSTLLSQYQPQNGSGGAITAGQANQTVNQIGLYPQQTVNGITVQAGDGGESSGGNLRVYMTDTLTAAAVQNAFDSSFTGGYLVTYLGIADYNKVGTVIGTPSSNGAVNGTAVALTYNGVLESQTAIEEGAYTFWGYEHLYYKGTLDGNGQPKLTFATNLVNYVRGLDSTNSVVVPNLSLKNMNVQRFGDGSTVSSTLH